MASATGQVSIFLCERLLKMGNTKDMNTMEGDNSWQISVNTGPGNGLVPNVIKSSPRSVLTYHTWNLLHSSRCSIKEALKISIH